MSEAEDREQEPAKLDPKEAMRQALERKKQAEHMSASHGITADREAGHIHGKAAGKREFRRKSG